MLRTLFVFGIIAVGGVYMFIGPFYGLLFYLWYAYFRPDFWLWDPGLVSALNLSLVIGTVLLLWSLPSFQTFRLTRGVVLVLLFLAQSILSLVMAEHFDWSLPLWIEFLKIIVVTLLITFLIRDRRQFRTVVLVICFSLGLEAAKQGWAQLILNPGAANNNPHPVLGDNNGVAVGIMMIVPLMGALAQTARSRWERYIHRFFFVGLVYRAISTYSRGGFLTAAAVGLMSLWRSPRKIRLLLGIAVLSGIVLSVMPPQFWDRMNTLTQSADEQDDSAKGRMYFWQVAEKMAEAKPLYGVGFNGFRQSFAAYDFSGEAWGTDRAVHSVWFGVVSEMGYPGLILLVAILGVSLHTCRRVRRSTQGRPDLADMRAYANALQSSFVAYAVGMTFLNGQYVEIFWHFVGLTVALERVCAIAVAEAPAPALNPGTQLLSASSGAPGWTPAPTPSA